MCIFKIHNNVSRRNYIFTTRRTARSGSARFSNETTEHIVKLDRVASNHIILFFSHQTHLRNSNRGVKLGMV